MIRQDKAVISGDQYSSGIADAGPVLPGLTCNRAPGSMGRVWRGP